MQTVKEKIKQRRLQMLVHSYIYYEKDENIISDAQWSKWAVELAQLQNDYPKESREVEYFNMFSAWDGSSGAFLRYDNHIVQVAERLLKNKDKQYTKPKLAESVKTQNIKVEKPLKSEKTVKNSVKSSFALF